MDNIDLVTLVRLFKKLENTEVYGYISSRLPIPVNLVTGTKFKSGGFFVRMQVLAVNLGRYKQYLKSNGIENTENEDIYMVNGSIALYVGTDNIFPDWYATKGTIRLGAFHDPSYLIMFPFKKSNNEWMIECNNLYTMDISHWGRSSRLYQSVQFSVARGALTIPSDVSSLPKFDARLKADIVTPVQNSAPVQNGVDVEFDHPTQSNTTLSTRFKPESRKDLLEKPKELSILEGILSSGKTARAKLVKEVKNKYSIEDTDYAPLNYMLDELLLYLHSKPTQDAKTGRALLKTYMSNFGEDSKKEYLGTKVDDYLASIFPEVAKFILDNSSVVTVQGDAWDFCVSAFSDKEAFYAGMLGVITSKNAGKLITFSQSCTAKGISFISLINDNPYMLLLLTSSFSYADVEYIAYCLNKANDSGIHKSKLLGLIHDYLNRSTVGSTVYEYKKLKSTPLGVTLTKGQYNQLASEGSYLTSVVRHNLKYYFNATLGTSNRGYPQRGWVNKGYNYILQLSCDEVGLGLNEAIKSGLAVKFNINGTDWVTSYALLHKEVYICNKVYELSTEKHNYHDSDIDFHIKNYEAVAGFKLEPEQVDAVHLCNCRCSAITGPAGSGKTTATDVLDYVLHNIEGDEMEIQYAAPTGKAAKRLQEVVKKKVRTFNSNFKIFGDTEDSIFDVDAEVSSPAHITFFLDEVAMANINLLYAVFKHFCNCNVFFLGDICQLPPIGKGTPFKDLLRFLPCVSLRVSKRSSENSKITLNSKLINECSDKSNWKPLVDGDDFRILPCNDVSISSIAVLLCKFYLNKASEEDINKLCKLTGRNREDFTKIPNLLPDDIQVVSPIGKSTYSWGTYQLNKELQPIFNPVSDYKKRFTYQISESSLPTHFAIGDRVIHTDSNMYSMQWYESHEDGIFKKTYGFGICNGDVGKIVGFYRAESAEFEDESGSKPDEFDYPDDLRDDSKFTGNNVWFVAVEYYDFMSNSNYYILYRAQKNIYITSTSELVLSGEDLKYLALFYAGTTHKMQGSQAKLIIGLLGLVNFNGFISRNMLYTEITRASEMCYLIGSVGNEHNSQLSIARGVVANEGVDTTLSLLFPQQHH